jgi:hypothetical protein
MRPPDHIRAHLLDHQGAWRLTCSGVPVGSPAHAEAPSRFRRRQSKGPASRTAILSGTVQEGP